MNKLIVTSLLCSAILSPAAIAEARQGFYLSGGIGLANTTYEATIDNQSSNESYGGFATSFKIGGYLSPNVALYFQREASWSSIDDTDYWSYGGMTGIGASYYFQPERGAYIEGGLGIGDWVVTDGDDSVTEDGFGFALGAGYELTDHIQIGVILTKTSMEDSTFDDVDYSTTAITGKIEFKL